MPVMEFQVGQWVQFHENGWRVGKIVELRPDWVFIDRPGHRKLKVAIADLKPLESK